LPFSNLGLSDVLSRQLSQLGYERPTDVQAQSLPIASAGGDLIAAAQTGTGKTAAFGLPMIDRLVVRGGRARRPGAPRGLVLVPTRELALQVHDSLQRYGRSVGVKTAAIVGGVSMRPQIDLLRGGLDIVVATPGRLLDHMQQKTIVLSAVEVVTLDEADRMLDMGFIRPLRRIAATLPAQRQTLLFSATLSPDVRQLAKEFTRNATHVDVCGSDVVASTVTHRIQAVEDGGKGDALARVLRHKLDDQALVFCKTKRRSDRVGEQLTRAGFRAAVIHGNKSQNARNRALDDFKSGRVSVLVATDIAARGLDIAHLPLVVNYDLPMVAQDYVHRVGRTGRAGRVGYAVSLVASEDRELLPAIRRLVAVPLEELGAPAHDGVRAAAPAAPRPSYRPAFRSARPPNRAGRRPGSRAAR
jgi:ATP-dependent RNA helicase RhlE